MNDRKRGLAEAAFRRLFDHGCIFLAIKVTAEVDEFSAVLDIRVDDLESAFPFVGAVPDDFAAISNAHLRVLVTSLRWHVLNSRLCLLIHCPFIPPISGRFFYVKEA